MNAKAAKNLIIQNVFVCAAAIVITSCGTATFTKIGSDAQIESLGSFHLAFIDEFAVPGKRFNAAAFDAKVNEGNAKFQQAIADEKFTARRPVLIARREIDVTHSGDSCDKSCAGIDRNDLVAARPIFRRVSSHEGGWNTAKPSLASPLGQRERTKVRGS